MTMTNHTSNNPKWKDDFNLSDKIQIIYGDGFLFSLDIKEFIRILKEDLDDIDLKMAIQTESPIEVLDRIYKIIDNRAGDKLN